MNTVVCGMEFSDPNTQNRTAEVESVDMASCMIRDSILAFRTLRVGTLRLLVKGLTLGQRPEPLESAR